MASHHGNTKKITAWISHGFHNCSIATKNATSDVHSHLKREHSSTKTPRLDAHFLNTSTNKTPAKKIVHSAFPHSGTSIEDERRTKGYKRHERKDKVNPTQIISNYQSPLQRTLLLKDWFTTCCISLCVWGLRWCMHMSRARYVACNFPDSLRLPIRACGWRLENFNYTYSTLYFQGCVQVPQIDRFSGSFFRGHRFMLTFLSIN